MEDTIFENDRDFGVLSLRVSGSKKVMIVQSHFLSDIPWADLNELLQAYARKGEVDKGIEMFGVQADGDSKDSKSCYYKAHGAKGERDAIIKLFQARLVVNDRGNSRAEMVYPYQDLNVYTFLTQEEMCQKCEDISVVKSYEKKCQRGF